MTDLRDRIAAALADYELRGDGGFVHDLAALLAEVLATMPKAGATFTPDMRDRVDEYVYGSGDVGPLRRAVTALLASHDALARDLAVAQDALRGIDNLLARRSAIDDQRTRYDKIEKTLSECGRMDAELRKARNAFEQIQVLAEYGTTGPETVPPCKSDALAADKATALRGSISTIARAALASVKP